MRRRDLTLDEMASSRADLRCPRRASRRRHARPVHELNGRRQGSSSCEGDHRIGIGGLWDSGKTAVIEDHHAPLDRSRHQAADHHQRRRGRRRTPSKGAGALLNGILIEEKIVGVETRCLARIRRCAAVCIDGNIAAVEELEEKYPDSDVILIEPAATTSRRPSALRWRISTSPPVIDVAAVCDAIPRRTAPASASRTSSSSTSMTWRPMVSATPRRSWTRSSG